MERGRSLRRQKEMGSGLRGSGSSVQRRKEEAGGKEGWEQDDGRLPIREFSFSEKQEAR